MITTHPSNRKFGFSFAIFLLLLSVYQLIIQKNTEAILFLFLFIATLFTTVFFPTKLSLFNKAWFRFGEMIGKIVSPFILGVIFFLILTPLALFLRWMGRDILLIKRRDVITYWVDRDPVGPVADSFKAQF